MIGYPQFRIGIPSSPTPFQRIPNPLYVDINAANGGTGTADSPLNSLSLAVSIAMGREGQVILVKAPESNPFRVEPAQFESTFDLTIKGWDSEPWHLYGSDIVTGWASIGGGIYSKTLNYSTVSVATVTTMTETIVDKVFNVKLKVAPVPAIPERGQIGYSGGVAYIRLPNDEDPNLHTIELARRNTGLRAYGFAKLIVEDMVGRNYLTAPLQVGLSTQPVGTGNLVARNCLLEYSGLNGVNVAGQNELTECYNVESYAHTNDGFNHRRTSGNGILILNGCKGGYNGDFAGQSSQGASAHTDATMIINGGEYNYNVSGGMVSIDTSINDLHGDTEYGPVTMTGNMRLGNTSGTIANQASCAWMDNTTGTVTGSVTVSNGGGVGVRVNTASAVTGLSNIISDGNALPDVIA